MGWSRGSGVMDDVIAVLKKHVDDDTKRWRIYTALIEVFENNDCDTLYECQGVDDAFDEAWNDLYPEEEEDDELANSYPYTFEDDDPDFNNEEE